MPGSEPLHLEPVADDGIRAILVGLGLWAACGIALLVGRDELADQGTQWLLTCGAGLLIGIIEWGIFARRAANARVRARATPPGAS